LGAETELLVSFETQNAIPASSKLFITLPANLAISATTQMLINNIKV